MNTLSQKEIEGIIDTKIDNKFSSFDNRIEEKIEKKLSLSVKYWYPTLITVVIAAIGAVLWFKNQLKPIEDDVSKLKITSSVPAIDPTSPLVDIQYLKNISLENNFTDEEIKKLQNIAYKLKYERKDLVVIIAGYTNDDKLTLGAQVSQSEKVAKKVAKFFLDNGIELERIFAKGHGSEVPNYFDKTQPLNSCIMLCDIFTLMKQRVSA